MKTFDEIYEELQSGDNNELNNLWKEAQKEKNKVNKIIKIICIPIDIVALIIFFNMLIKGTSIFAIMPLLIPLFIINFFVFVIVNIIFTFSKKSIEYNKKYKQVVISKLMNNFYNNLEYFPEKGMPAYIYQKLQYEHYDKYRSDDYFEALINNKNSIQMAEVLTQEEEEYKDSDGNTQTRTITKFHGLFAKIELDKSINSDLKIGQNGVLFSGKRLKMDSSEFEKYFDVQASNQIIGMQLLTADVMEELVDFMNKTNMMFDIYIKGNELYLRFHSGSMFEAYNLKTGALDKDLIQKYFYMLNFTYNLSNRLIKLVNETEV